MLCGNDVRTMADSVKDVILNEEVIAINQDVLGKQGRVVETYGNCEVWVKELSDGYAVAVLNRGKAPETATVKFSELGVGEKARVRDLWVHRGLGRQEELTLTIAPHATEMFKLTK